MGEALSLEGVNLAETPGGRRLRALQERKKAQEEKRRAAVAPPLDEKVAAKLKAEADEFGRNPRRRGRFVQGVADFVLAKLAEDMRSGTLDGKEFRATAKQFLAFMNPLAAAGALTPDDDDTDDEEGDDE